MAVETATVALAAMNEPARTLDQSAGSNSGWRALLRLCGVLGAALSCIYALAPDRPISSRRQPFDPAPLELLRETSPRYVLIGNSMLRSRINPNLLALELGEPVGFLTQRGAFSAVWYLTLKNIVAPAGLKKGSRVGIMFRSDFLTQPKLDPHRHWDRDVDRVATDDELTFDSILAGFGTRWQDRARFALLDIRDPSPWRSAFHRGVERIAFSGFPTASVPIRADSWRLELNEFFDPDNLRPGPATTSGADRSQPLQRFEAQLENSFLPHMLDLADDHDFELWFIHVKQRPRKRSALSHNPALDRELNQYIASLRSYLEARGAGLIDLRHSKRITRDMFGNGDHISPDNRFQYTKMFPELAAPMFERATQP